MLLRIRRHRLPLAGALSGRVRRLLPPSLIVAFANRLPQGIGGTCQKRLAEEDSPDDVLLGIVLGTAAVVGIIVPVPLQFPLHGPTGIIVATDPRRTPSMGASAPLADVGHAVPRIPATLWTPAGSARDGVLLWSLTVLAVRSPTPSSLVGLVVLGGSVYVSGVTLTDATVRRVLRTVLADTRAYFRSTLAT